mmetsp:Transcript_21222/g.49390  ORF Transcript_21222/g.49390 Transcript_21222/m.49390 type:complete len:386 (-) Transcript_21222:106-1263(-)
MRLLVAFTLLGAAGSNEDVEPHLHFVTFMNRFRRTYAFLQISAEAHGIYPKILGYGAEAWWPDGLGVKINTLRAYVNSASVMARDVVVFVDAFDVIVFAGETEIMEGFIGMERRWNTSLFFNAEQHCYPRRDGLCEGYPSAPSRWRYLNSGLIAGRAWAFRELLRDPVPNVIKGSDQAWYQRRFREQRQGGGGGATITLDSECRFLCSVANFNDTVMVLDTDRRLVRSDVGFRPQIVHFAGTGHWTMWLEGRAAPTTGLLDVFQKLYPKVSQQLLDVWGITAELGTTHDIGIYNGPGFWGTMGLVLCIQCNLLGSKERECEFFAGAFSGRCMSWTLRTVALVACCAGCCAIVPLAASRRPASAYRLLVRGWLPWSRPVKLPEVVV